MAEKFTYLPQSVLDLERRQQEASDWAAEQRKLVAAQWADEQRAAVADMLDQEFMRERAPTHAGPAQEGQWMPTPTSPPLPVAEPPPMTPRQRGYGSIAEAMQATETEHAGTFEEPTEAPGVAGLQAVQETVDPVLANLGIRRAPEGEQRGLRGIPGLTGGPLGQAQAGQMLQEAGEGAFRRGLEQAGAPGREQAPIDLGPIQTSPAGLGAFAAGVVLGGPGGGKQKAAKEAGEAALRAGVKPITLTPEQEIERLRLDKFPEWVRDTIAESAEQADFARQQRRGVVPEAVSEGMADDIGRSVEEWIKQGKAGKAYNTEETRALRNALTAQAERVNAAARQVAESEAAGGITDAMLANSVMEGEKLQSLLTVAEGARAEWGRAGLAWRAATRSVEAPPTEAIRRIYTKLGGRDNALSAVQEYNRMLSQGATPIQMAQFWSRVEKPPPGFEDWFKALRYNSMMSGPRTLEINWVGNALEVPWRLTRDIGASTFRGRPEEIAPELSGAWAGFGKGVKAFMETVSNGITNEQALAGDLPSSLAARVRNPVGRAAATALELPGRLNMAADAWAQQVAYGMAIGRRAGQTASKQGLRGKAWAAKVDELTQSPTTAMQREALDISQRMTYKGEMGSLGTGLAGIQRWSTLGIPFGNIILPFLRTVYHLTARGIDRSPIGVLGTAADVARGVYREGRELPKGVVPLGERLGDNTMGMIGGLGLTYLAFQGNISGAGPDDPEKKDLLRSQGWQPYSVKVGDRWVSYSNWGPLSIPFALAASTAEAALYRKPDDGILAQIGDNFRRFGELGTEQTYLQGIGAFYKAVKEPDRYGAQWLTGFVSSLIPYGAALNTVGQVQDPYLREPEKFNVEQALKARLPGVREEVPIRQDVFGRPQENPISGAGALQPLRVSPDRPDPVAQAFLTAGVDIGQPSKSITYQGAKITLTPDEQRAFERYRGEQLRTLVERETQSPVWGRRTPAQQKQKLEEFKRSASERAQQQILREMQDRVQRVRQAKGLP